MSNRVIYTVAVVTCSVAVFFALGLSAVKNDTEDTETPHGANMALLRHVTRRAAELPVINPEPAFAIKENYKVAGEVIANGLDIFETIDSVEFPTTEMVLTSIGKYYITGYTSIECGGSTMTASGATVYYAPDELRLTDPTTCAIDPVIHDFGDLFYIEEFDRVYVAKDTGSAVKKKHLDLYFPDDMYNYALSITGYYTVYSVEYVETTFRPADYDIRKTVALKVIGWKIKTD